MVARDTEGNSGGEGRGQEFTAIVVLRGQYWMGTQLPATTEARERRMTDQTMMSMDNCDELEQQRMQAKHRDQQRATYRARRVSAAAMAPDWPSRAPVACSTARPAFTFRAFAYATLLSQVPPSPILQLLDT